jgi:hypothetical protein
LPLYLSDRSVRHCRHFHRAKIAGSLGASPTHQVTVGVFTISEERHGTFDGLVEAARRLDVTSGAAQDVRGLGGTGVLNDGAGKLKGASVAVGTENGDSGLVNVFGAGAAFSMTTLSVGSFESGNSPAGGVGTLVVSDGGYVSVAKTLALNDFASADTNLQETFSGGIYLSGGALEIDRSSMCPPSGTLSICVRLLSPYVMKAGVQV